MTNKRKGINGHENKRMIKEERIGKSKEENKFYQWPAFLPNAITYITQFISIPKSSFHNSRKAIEVYSNHVNFSASKFYFST